MATAPATPTFTLASEVSQGRNRIDVSNSAHTQDVYLEVNYWENSVDGWQPLRGAIGINVGTTAATTTFRDLELFSGARRYYRARAYSTDSTSTAYSAWAPFDYLDTLFFDWWVGAPGATNSFTRFKVQIDFQDLKFSYPTRNAQHDIIDRADPFIMVAKNKGARLQLPVTLTGKTATDYRKMVTSAGTLCIQSPSGERWYMTPGDVDETWVASKSTAQAPRRVITVQCSEVKRP